MKKFYTLIKIVFFTVVALLCMQTKSSANSITQINMDVYIDKDGNATITEVWNGNLTQGTEGFRPFTNLGNSTIYNFSVTDETGTTYESLSPWNTSASFNSKAYKSGINHISNGVELCWGISKYGNKTYTLKYNISNFITQFLDTQGLYFNFINLDQAVGNANIIIRSDFDFSLDNARIWAFGNNGTINFENGNIVLNSNGKLSSSEYMVALVRFEKNLFNTSNNSNKSFDDIYDSAMSGVTDNNYGLMIFKYFLYSNTPVIISSILFIFFIKKITYNKKRYKNYNSYNNYNMRNNDNIEYAPLDLGKKIQKDEITYFRDIPCDGNLYYAYWLMIKYNVLKEDKCKNGLLGAILLKWIKEGYIELSKTRGGLFNLRDNMYAIDLNNLDHSKFESSNDLEKKLMRMLTEASGPNNILEAKEFEKWCTKNYSVLDAWFDIVITYETSNLQQKRLIFETTETHKRFFKSKTVIAKHVYPKVRDEAIYLFGLKQFLLDYTLMEEKQNLDVHLLEDYLIFAQLLGIADKVEEQFSKLYPDFNKISKINTEYSGLYIRTLSSSITSTLLKETIKNEKRIKEEAKRASRARERSRSHSYSGNDRDSGGGGSSYSSGGSSSGGSSGGGFR